MEESKNLQRSFSMPDVLETNPSSLSPGTEAKTDTLFSKSHGQGGLGIINKLSENNHVRSPNASSIRGFQQPNAGRTLRHNKNSGFDLSAIKNSLIMSMSSEDMIEDQNSSKVNNQDIEISSLDIGRWNITLDMRNVSVLKDALTQAQSAINFQTEMISQQARQIEYLKNLVSKLQGENIGDRSCQTIRLSPDHSIAFDSVKESEEATNSSPGDGVVNSYFSALGVVNHRDLTRFAVRRRLVSPSIDSGPVAHGENPLQCNSAYSAPPNLRGTNASNNIHKNVRVNTEDVGNPVEMYYSPSNFITPTNIDYSMSKYSDNVTFGSVPDALGNHNISPIEYNYSPEGSTDSHETTYSSIQLSSSRHSDYKSRNTDSDEKHLEDSEQRNVPPKGLAARLAMSANERRKVATSGRFKKLPSSSIPSSLIVNQHNNHGNISISAGKTTSAPSIDEDSNNYYNGSRYNVLNGGSTSKSNSTPSSHSSEYFLDEQSNTSSNGMLFQPSHSPLSPRPTREGITLDDKISTGSQIRFTNSQLSYSTSKLPISSVKNNVDSDDSGSATTVPPPRPVSSFQPGRRMTPDKNYRDLSRNVEIDIDSITGSDSLHSKSTRSCNNSQLRNRAISQDVMLNNNIETTASMASKNQFTGRQKHSSIFNWRGVSYSYGERNSSRSDVYVFIAHDNPRLIRDYNSANITGSSGTPIVGSNMSGMEVMIETKNDSGLTCFILATIVCNGSFDSVQDVNISDQRGSAWIVCNKLKAFRAKMEEFPSRIRGEIREIDLEGVGDSQVDLSHLNAAETFFSECSSKVDVILDPYRTGYWFPYFEGHRKMAPQFRSKGIGYLRLGDDMSQYGTAFISLNAGQTYLDFGKLASTKLIDDEKKAKIIAEKRAKIAKNRGAKKLS